MGGKRTKRKDNAETDENIKCIGGNNFNDFCGTRGGEEMNFRELLKSKRWNCSTLAKAIGEKPQSVFSWANKRCTPSPEKIKKIAQTLECTTDEVIDALLVNKEA